MDIAILAVSGIALLLSIILLITLIVQRNTSGAKASDISANIRLLNEKTAEYAEKTVNQITYSFMASLKTQLDNSEKITETQLKNVRDAISSLEERHNRLTDSVVKNLEKTQLENKEQMEQMRELVSDKLSKNIENHFNQSFARISDALQKVTDGLAEMANLTVKVTDLNKVLGNIKTRGILGEVSLGNILEEILSPEQYVTNFSLGNGREAVEYAVHLPGKNDKGVYLPIDAKFPMADYEKLLICLENGDKSGAESCAADLEKRIRQEAKDIKTKYIMPPVTTDFAILYLPIEGLFAEVVRRSNLINDLQRNYGIMVAGPTTLCALLNSLQMGFKTLAVEKKSKEIWDLLASFKKQFASFNVLLEKTCKQIDTVSNTMLDAKKKTETIQKQLRSVERLTENEDTETAIAATGIFSDSNDDE